MGIILEIAVVIVIVIIQVKSFWENRKKLKLYKLMFPDDISKLDLSIELDTRRVVGISTKHENILFETILKSINGYLRNNSRNSTDFHLIKDIVDRNAEAVESEISAQVPFPLYYGLIGTMGGAAISIVSLVWGNGLTSLMSADLSASGSNAISSLLIGVAIAMFTSCLGVILTTIGSDKLKSASANVEASKNSFLSWAQARLLPKLNTNFENVMNRMIDRLYNFNQTFSDNSKQLRETLEFINTATEGQAKILAIIERLDVNSLAQANIMVYSQLKGCSEEIGNLAAMLDNSREYLQKVITLNESLNDIEKRMHAMEEVAIYFKKERTQLDAVKVNMLTKISDVDRATKDALDKYKEHSKLGLEEVRKLSGEQYEQLRKVMETQTNAIAQRMNELATINSELKQMKPIKDSIERLHVVIDNQSKKMDALISSIQVLVTTRASSGGSVLFIPRWIKIIIVILTIFIILATSITIAYFLLSYFSVI